MNTRPSTTYHRSYTTGYERAYLGVRWTLTVHLTVRAAYPDLPANTITYPPRVIDSGWAPTTTRARQAADTARQRAEDHLTRRAQIIGWARRYR